MNCLIDWFDCAHCLVRWFWCIFCCILSLVNVLCLIHMTSLIYTLGLIHISSLIQLFCWIYFLFVLIGCERYLRLYGFHGFFEWNCMTLTLFTFHEFFVFQIIDPWLFFHDFNFGWNFVPSFTHWLQFFDFVLLFFLVQIISNVLKFLLWRVFNFLWLYLLLWGVFNFLWLLLWSDFNFLRLLL